MPVDAFCHVFGLGLCKRRHGEMLIEVVEDENLYLGLRLLFACPTLQGGDELADGFQQALAGLFHPLAGGFGHPRFLKQIKQGAVSYTHLTLPTILRV